jgi:IS30 family transposase
VEGAAPPKRFISVTLGKRLSGACRELNRNGTNGVYTGDEAQALSVKRRLETKPSSKLDDHALMREITALFKQDLAADQISGRLGARRPDQREKRASTATVYTYLYGEMAQPSR